MAASDDLMVLTASDRLVARVSVDDSDGGHVARLTLQAGPVCQRIEDPDPSRLVGALREAADAIERGMA